jgi:hypothetical protein
MTEGATQQEGAASRADEPQAPAILHHAVDAAPRLEPIRGGGAVDSLHHTWARVSARQAGGPSRHVERLAPGLSGAVRDDRELIGELVRAVDALAARCDELADRVMTLEGALAEMVEVFGADLTRLRAAAVRGDEVRSPHD